MNRLLAFFKSYHSFDQLPIATFILDLNGLTVRHNPSFDKMLGLAHRRVAAAHWQDWVHPSDHGVFEESLGLKSSTPVNIRVLPAGGQVRWKDLKTSLSSDGSHWIGCLSDIEQHVVKSTQLHASNRNLSALINDLPGMVYRCRNDPAWTMEYLSEGCTSLTGYPPNDIVGSQIRSYGSIIHPEDKARVWSEVQINVQNKRKFDIRYRIFHKDGHCKWVWERGNGIFADDSELLGLEGFITDIDNSVFSDRVVDSTMTLGESAPWESNLLFFDRIDRALYRHTPFALLAIELRRFSENLSDDALKTAQINVAARLKPLMRPLDSLTMESGNRFYMIVEPDDKRLSHDNMNQIVKARAKQIFAALAEPLSINGKKYYLSCSIGSSSSFYNYPSHRTLTQDAIVALNQAIGQGEQQFVLN